MQCGQATTLYLSKDRGATWAPITNAGDVFRNGRTTLGVGVPGDNVVYAYSSDVADTAMQDVYRSADGGDLGCQRRQCDQDPDQSRARLHAGHEHLPRAVLVQPDVLVDPRDPARNTVWIGGDLGTAQSTNGGGTWTIKTWWLYSQVPELPYAHADHHAAAVKMTGTPTSSSATTAACT